VGLTLAGVLSGRPSLVGIAIAVIGRVLDRPLILAAKWIARLDRRIAQSDLVWRRLEAIDGWRAHWVAMAVPLRRGSQLAGALVVAGLALALAQAFGIVTPAQPSGGAGIAAKAVGSLAFSLAVLAPTGLLVARQARNARARSASDTLTSSPLLTSVEVAAKVLAAPALGVASIVFFIAVALVAAGAG
jgi:hypothetical protein